MSWPILPRNVSCAAQHASRTGEASFGPLALGGFRSRAALVVLVVALLGAASAVREFDLSIRDRRVDGSTSTLRVNRGDTVLLRWRTDETVSLHVHGYDVQGTVSPNSSRTLRIEATIAGRFPISAHEFGNAPVSEAGAKKRREVTLLYLEVLPE
jgi:hypothetical protein